MSARDRVEAEIAGLEQAIIAEGVARNVADATLDGVTLDHGENFLELHGGLWNRIRQYIDRAATKIVHRAQRVRLAADEGDQERQDQPIVRVFPALKLKVALQRLLVALNALHGGVLKFFNARLQRSDTIIHAHSSTTFGSPSEGESHAEDNPDPDRRGDAA